MKIVCRSPDKNHKKQIKIGIRVSQPNHIVQQVQTLPRIEPQVHRIISSQGGLIQNSAGGQAKPMILIAKKPAVIGEQQIFIPFPANGIANAPIQNLQKIQMQPVHTIQEHLQK